jgi:hypothetical protein
MTVTGRKPGGRYSPEQRQEDRSEGQLKDRLAEFGWPLDRVNRDLGEDFTVRIYDDGASTGLGFHVQLKSTANSAELTLKQSPTLSYDLEVKDLLHWEVSTSLVVLILWDVKLRTGWWRPIPEIIKDLDTMPKAWREQKTAAVSVPLANGTDDDGLSMLRWKVATHNISLISKPETSEYVLSFSQSEGNWKGFEALQQALDTGEPVLLEGELVPSIEWPEWHRLAYGAAYPKPISIHVSPSPSTASITVRVEAESSEAAAALSYVELRCVAQGRTRISLDNEHQGLPLVVAFEAAETGAWLRLKQARRGRNVYEALDAASFVLATMGNGCTIRVMNLATGQEIFTVGSPQEPTKEVVERARRLHGLLDKLCFIQRRIAAQGTLSLADGISREDVEATALLFKILGSGRSEGRLSMSFEIAPNQRTLADGMMAFEVDGPPTKILGVDVSVGKARIMPIDNAAFLSKYNAHRFEANRTGSAVQFAVRDLPIMTEYVEWMPDDLRWERLSEMAARQEGYCTLSQARWVGYADDVFLALVSAGRVHACAPDVFRLAQFPRSEREEHVILWLQTDRQGVLSHETALLLHELSDILPQRLHITVPPGFDPGSRQFDPTVELLRGDVADDEKCWLGPVPYTSALRTLRDCIAIGVSPDLIEQAIEQSLERGLFTRAQIPVILPAKSA